MTAWFGVCSVQAETVIFDPSHPTRATGITDLNVDGVLYDVSFTLWGTAESVYGDYPGNYDFITAIGASNAVVTVNAALNGAGALEVGAEDVPSPNPSVLQKFYRIGFESFLAPPLETESVIFWESDGNSGTWLRAPDSDVDCYALFECERFWAKFTPANSDQSPTITEPPANTVAEVGDMVTLTVEATGTGPLSYQWARNNLSLDGETNSVLTLENVQTADAGFYEVRVSNSSGSDRNEPPAILMVFEPGQGQAPTFTLQPEGQYVPPGTDVTFTVEAEGTPWISYQWTRNGVELPGETSTVLELEDVQNEDGGVYRAIAANDFGSAESEGAALIINLGEPTITEDPEGQTVEQGGTAVFTVAATGAPPLAYQWYKWDGSVGFIPLDGETSPTLTLTDVQPDLDNINFYAGVTNQYGNALSDGATLTVTVPEAEPPTITSEPQDQTVTEGDTAVFTVTATGTEPLTYQWYQMEPDYLGLEGETSATLTLTNVQLDQTGAQYSVTVDNNVGQAFSRNAVLTVEAAPEQPTLTIESSAPNEVTISWSPAAAGFVLQERAEVDSGNWTDSPSGSTNPVTLQTGGTAMYFQLRN